jgi:hypothetical protein
MEALKGRHADGSDAVGELKHAGLQVVVVAEQSIGSLIASRAKLAIDEVD